MNLLAVAALVVSALAACSGADASDPVAVTYPSAAVTRGPEDQPALMAVALEELVTENHTFGEGPPPFTEYLIQSHLDLDAGAAGSHGNGRGRALTAAERDAVEEAVSPLGPVRWIDDPREWRTDDLRPTIEGAVILGVGEPAIDGDTTLVAVSLWCGGLCGTRLTYRLDKSDDMWRVTGTEGPIAIS